MNLKRTTAVALLVFTAFLPLASHGQTRSHRVVFALTSGEEADWKFTLGNIQNLFASIAPESSEVELVAYGPGLGFVRKGSSAESGIVALQAKHVRFVACENSMRMQHVSAADLIPGVTVVPSGVAEVVARQEQGWSYIKAGR